MDSSPIARHLSDYSNHKFGGFGQNQSLVRFCPAHLMMVDLAQVLLERVVVDVSKDGVKTYLPDDWGHIP
jgi:hypothetical protein